MFKTARMRKIKIITLEKYISQTVDALHSRGILQISDISDRIQQDPELAEMVTPSKAAPQTGKLSSLLMKTSGISELLGNSLSENHGLKDLVMSFIKPDIPVPQLVDDLTTEELIKHAEDLLAQVEAKTSVIEGKLSALDTETSALQSNKSLAIKLSNFDMDLALLNDSQFTSTIVGRINVESASEIKNELGKLTDELELYMVPTEEKEYSNIVVVTLNEFADAAYAVLRKFDFEKYDIGDAQGSPSEVIANADARLAAIEGERSAVKAELYTVAEEWDDKILALKEQLENEKEKNEIFSAFVRTKDTYMLEAWVPLKDVDELKALVEKSTDGHCTFEITDVEGTDDEDVPVLQQNGRYAKPYEFIVDMYAPVRYNEIDPTILVAIMLPFFFGFCLTDAIYGLIVAIIGVVLVKGLGKVKKSMNSFGWIFIACGIWSVILGLITNGCLGDFPERMLGIRLPTIISSVESFVHPDTILIVALIIGIIYTNIGFAIGAINNIRYGNMKEAWGSQLVWFVFEAGLVFLVLGFLMPAIGLIGMIAGGVLIVASLGILVWANGAYGIMDVFGYMGDILSYARLLALCLATGGIAMTVNILTQLVGTMIPIPVVPIVLAVIVFIGGHIANFAFQVLGAFVNAMRLNYVEFFSQFFMSGNSKFEAFKASRIFTKTKD